MAILRNDQPPCKHRYLPWPGIALWRLVGVGRFLSPWDLYRHFFLWSPSPFNGGTSWTYKEPEKETKAMKAAIYCWVSTEDQEREGTSLHGQLKACQDKAQELGYEIREKYTVSEIYSGLSLDRPKLAQLRQGVRAKEVDVVVAYTLDHHSFS